MNEERHTPFEEMFAQLEEIVRKLENETLPLDQSLKLFEKGIKLSAECRKRLENVEIKVKALVKEGESFRSEDFPLGEEESR